MATAIITIIIISVYTLLRWAHNPLAGLYLLKRLSIPTILAFSYSKLFMLGPIIGIELIFAFARLFLEEPESKPQKVSIFV